MAKFYNKEKSKLGTLTGSIITFPTQLQSNEPTDTNNKKLLPSGYIRCDGSVYSASVYPLLAEILGTGIDSKFKQTATFLRDDQFQVPDLLVKHIRATASSNAGNFNDLEYENSLGTTLKKSGIGLDVLSNIDPVYTLTYSGSFFLPSTTVALRGEPAFSRTLGDYTETSEIPGLGIVPHAHFSTTTRSRTINYGGSNSAQTQNNFNRNTSSLNVDTWFPNTFQKLCQHSAETASGPHASPASGYNYVQLCTTTCRFNQSAGGFSCLIPASGVSGVYPVRATGGNYSQRTITSVIGTNTYSSTGYLKCSLSSSFLCNFAGPTTSDVSIALPASYTGTNLPFAQGDSTTTGYTGVSNITTQTTDTGNDALHKHIVPLTANPHTYSVQTTAQNFSSEGLVSTVSIKTTSEKKADNYIQPYIVVEYLIKV